MNNHPPKRVLLVDDDAEIRDSVRTVLELHGYNVLLACDGSEGLVRAERDAPDLIVLDVLMPRRSGFAVLDRLAKRPAAKPRIIVVTANEGERQQELATSKGADGFLQKPFELGQLVTMINSLLEPTAAA